ncbi:2-amino-4-hydroxy-6-hydroxymethyldihydropteridine diphosphokinase [Erythrobacter litoralis]|nr:2-amino-4-hydroxy-6-hydroxymethyldihydropteridine diphosphokinase [Erythrobacter litoralis]
MRAHGLPPEALITAATEALGENGWNVRAVSPTIRSAPVGPSQRRYANAAALIESNRPPEAMLAELQEIEHRFGRQRRGQRWRARPLDLDIVLWSGGAFASDRLTIPHPLFRQRDFVLRPAAAIVPHWRDPVSGLTVRQLAARLVRPRIRNIETT